MSKTSTTQASELLKALMGSKGVKKKELHTRLKTIYAKEFQAIKAI